MRTDSKSSESNVESITVINPSPEMGEDPAPCVLFAESLEHDELCEHVDEIRFTESVLITAFEILDTASSCSAVPLIGETFPASFAVELFARARGEPRFRAVCPAFTFTSTSPTSLQTEVIVTDHMVIRGVYSSLTLVVYGNPIRELPDLNSLADAPVHSAQDVPDHPKTTPRFLKLQRCDQADDEMCDSVWKLAFLAKVSSTARSALIKSACESNEEERRRILSSSAQASGEPVGTDNDCRSQTLQQLLSCLQLNRSEETFFAALAAVRLLCLDTRACFDFVVTDGMHLLIEVLQGRSDVFTVAETLAVQSLEVCTRHAFACEAVVGLKQKSGYGTILATLLQARRHKMSQLLFEVLQRLRVYELAVSFQAEVDFLLAENLMDEYLKERLSKATNYLKLLTNVLRLKDSATVHSTRCLDVGDFSEVNDRYLFTPLQEMCFMASLAALVSVENGLSKLTSFTKLLSTSQAFVVSLLSSGYGTLLLSLDSEATEAVMKGISGVQYSQEDSSLTLKQAAFLVRHEVEPCPQEVTKLLHISFNVVDTIEHLIAAGSHFETVIFSLWKLVRLSRTHAGRQALRTILHVDEAFSAILKILEDAAASKTNEKLVLASHYAAEIFYVIFTDSALLTWVSWTSQASKLQKSFLALKDTEAENNELVSRLQLLVELAIVYQSKGGADLLRYAAFVSGGEESTGSQLSGSVLHNIDILQLTACMRTLAFVCTPEIAAAFIGDNAMSFLTTVLNYSATLLEGDEFVSSASEQKSIHAAVKLLVPTLLLLLSILQRLRGQQYHSTKLVTVLMRLHRVLCGMLGAHTSVRLDSWEEGGTEISAALRLIASNLAHWLVFGWQPAVQPLISVGHRDPVETFSSLKLLGDLLPAETDLTHKDIPSIFRNFPVEICLGVVSVPQVSWHTQTPYKESLFEVLLPSILHLADVILRLASTACTSLLSVLKNVIIRISCVNASQSALILQPLLSYIEEQASVAVVSDVHAFRVDCYISFLSELIGHSASKAVVLQLKVVEVLCEALASSLENERFMTSRGILIFFSRLCISESFMTFGDCCQIASSLTYSAEVLPLDQSYEALADAFESLSGLRLGRAAFVAVSTRSKDSSGVESYDEGLLLRVTKRLCTALNAEDALILSLTNSFALGALKLAAAGRSVLGLGAMQILFGCEQHSVVLNNLINAVDKRADEQSIAAEVKKTLQVLVRLLQRPVQLQELHSKVEAIGKGGQTSRTFTDTFIPFRSTNSLQQALEDRFQECTASFTWECQFEFSTPKRKLSGRVSVRKKLRTSRQEKPVTSSAHGEKEGKGYELGRCLTEDFEPGAFDELQLFASKDLATEEYTMPSPREELTRSGLVVRLGAMNSSSFDLQHQFKKVEVTAGSQQQQEEPGLLSAAAEETVIPLSMSLPTTDLLQQDQHSPVLEQAQQQGSSHFQLQHHQYHFSPLAAVYQHQPLSTPRTQESWSLQQILASPEALQELLKDQARLTKLLEDHPRLLSLLQEKMNFI